MNDFKINKKKSTYRKHKKQLFLFNTIVSIILAVCVFATGALSLLAYTIGNMRYTDIDTENIGISEEAKDLPKEIINIALFGIDSKSTKVENLTEALSGRSDTIIILSINTINGTIKMTSILRDSWVPMLNSKGKATTNKINAAYSFGGAENAIRTLNSNFGLNITDYVAVNMSQMERIVDILDGDGLKVNITSMEKRRINELIGARTKQLTKSGWVTLDSIQAVAYSRIRDDSEEVRVMRQQKILGLLLENAKQLNPTEYPAILNKLLSFVETSMSFDDIIPFASMLSSSSLHLQSTAIPGKEVVAEGGVFEDTGGRWVWKYDIDKAKSYIYNWIYGI